MGAKRDKVKCAVRKTVKWGGAGLTVLMVVVWIGSGWLGLYFYSAGRGVLTLQCGQLMGLGSLRRVQEAPADYFWFQPQTGDFYWWFEWGAGTRGNFYAVPLWLPSLLSLLATAAAWRADLKHIRRVRAGLCGSCGYDRAGLAAGAVCPECGAAARA